MKKILFNIAVISSFAFAQGVLADQIEKESAEAVPQGVMVKSDPASNIVEVYKIPTLDSRIRSKTASAEEMKTLILDTEIAKNKIAEFKIAKKELENASTEACWYGGGWGWGGYSPYYYGYNNYYPYSYGYGCNSAYYGNSYFNYGYGNGCGGYGYSRYNYGYNYGYNNYNYGMYY